MAGRLGLDRLPIEARNERAGELVTAAMAGGPEDMALLVFQLAEIGTTLASLLVLEEHELAGSDVLDVLSLVEEVLAEQGEGQRYH